MLALGLRSGFVTIPFYNKVANSNKVYLECVQSIKEAIELELGLRRSQFVVIESDGTKLGIIVDVRIIEVALAEIKANHNMQYINCKDNIGWQGIVNWTEGW